jgi:SAM-dependent methyltransferase
MYGRNYLPLWSDLARSTKRVLKPGGKLVLYSGNHFLLEKANRLAEHLTFERLVPILHADESKIPWKPLLVFAKAPLITSDDLPYLMQGAGREKEFHWCQQPVKELREIIRSVTNPGDLILDPCCGSGTTLLAARLEGRRAIGIEIDEHTYRVARRRLAMRPIEASESMSQGENGSPDNPYVNLERPNETDARFSADNPYLSAQSTMVA